jgi:tripartite-type tricarboxylate transporter receptor subunit TctC
MKLRRRQFLHLAAGAIALPAVSRIARAQAYPARPITMIVPLAAGSTLDLVGRVMAERMTKSLGKPVIIENVSGADGSIGGGRAARARADGYTIGIGTSGTHVLNGAFYSLQYDVLDDFAPISLLATLPLVLLARKTIPAKDLNELIAWLKANPNKASAGITTGAYRLLTAFFQKETLGADRLDDELLQLDRRHARDTTGVLLTALKEGMGDIVAIANTTQSCAIPVSWRARNSL